MKHKLIIFTQDFPYEKSEPFLESELPYLESVFDQVLIISTALHKGYQLTRKIGPLTDTYPITRPNGKLKKAWGLFNGVLHYNKNVNEEVARHKGFREKAAVLYYSGRYESVKRKCEKVVDAFVGEDTEQTVSLYSYWFVETAQVASFYAEKYREKGIQCKAVTRAHGFDLYENRNPAGFFPFREYVLRRMNYVFPCSIDGEQHLITRFPEYEDKVSKRYLGTCDHGINPEGKDDTFTIVTCSYLISVKRLNLVADALKRIDLMSSVVKIKWICIGDGPEREQLQQSVSTLKESQVVFFGSMKNEDVLTWYQSNHVDLFVNTSSSEGLPVSIMEASSFGIPSLATNVGGTSEIVIDGENGRLLSENLTAEKLAEEVISFYLMNTEEKNKYRRRAREIWKKSFCANDNYRAFAEELLTGV